jgi:hypothetical protein
LIFLSVLPLEEDSRELVAISLASKGKSTNSISIPISIQFAGLRRLGAEVRRAPKK